MRKIKQLAYASAIALLSMGMVACTSEEIVENGNNNPNNSVTGDVIVDFVLNVSQDNNGGTRMSAANTQATTSETFRGISKGLLLSYKQKAGDPLALVDGKPLTAASAADRIYDLGTTIARGGVDANNSRHIVEISLPNETNTLLFYGKAIKDATGEMADFQQGNIDYNVQQNLASTTFSLKPIVPTGDKRTEFGQYKALLLKVLNTIMGTQVDLINAGFTGIAESKRIFKWSSLVYKDANNVLQPISWNPVDESDPLSATGEILAKVYASICTIYNGESRSGSGADVLSVMNDLYSVVEPIYYSVPSSEEERIAQCLSDAIYNNILHFFNPSSSGLTWRNNSDLKAATADAALYNMIPSTGSTVVNFPDNFYITPGVTSLVVTYSTYEKTVESTPYVLLNSTTFNYADTRPLAGSNVSLSLDNYMFPAELCYFGNSPVRVSDNSHVTADYPNGVTNWVTESEWTSDWDKDKHVLSTTRSVAMRDNINYGTALMRTTVKYGAANLQDNNRAIQQARLGADEANNIIPASADVFRLTGILVGGQPNTVGWNFLSTGTTWDKFIYDKDIKTYDSNGNVTKQWISIPEYSASGSYCDYNYTLVWDNWNQAQKDSKQNLVYVALEFVNNSGQEFWGEYNLVHKGAKFYIVGVLDPDAVKVEGKTATEIAGDRSLGVAWPSNYALPPLNNDGTTIQQRRVFMQDFMTDCKFVIGENSLSHAYVTVPDLRSSQLSLGLSVDMSWGEGLSYPTVPLGGE